MYMETPISSTTCSSEELSSIRKHHLLLASVIGLGIGAVAVMFEWTVSLVSKLQGHVIQFFENENYDLSLAGLVCSVVVCGVVGAFVGALTQFVAPEAGGSGIPHVKAVLSHLQSLRGIRIMLVKFIGGALVIGTRFSLGREGPTIHIGASIADEVAKRSKVPAHLKDHLIACGAGAGLAAAFNAPLAGFLFIIEELRREVNSITLGMALLGTVLADAVVQFYKGPDPMLDVPHLGSLPIETIPAVVIIALGATFGGLLFNKVLVLGVVKVPPGIPLWVRGAVVGCLVGACFYVVPPLVADEQFVFKGLMHRTSLEQASLAILGLYFIFKLLLTVACYATGVPGGIFAPLLVQGAFMGFFMAKLETLASIPVPHEAVAALIGMTAFFAASVRAPFTGVVLLAEMTNGFALLLPLLGVALIGYFIGELSGSKPIYERLLEVSREKNT